VNRHPERDEYEKYDKVSEWFTEDATNELSGVISGTPHSRKVCGSASERVS
jgi:hypothetical protein